MTSVKLSSNHPQFGMLHEIAEAVEFIISYLYCKLPRLKVYQFGEQLANLLLDHYSIDKLSAEAKCLIFDIEGKEELQCIVSASNSVGINEHEIIYLLPSQLILHIKSSEVFYQASDNKFYRIPTGTADLMEWAEWKLNPLKLEIRECQNDLKISYVIEEETECKFTTGSFAKTRFGSIKLKTQHSEVTDDQYDLVPPTRSDEVMVDSSSSVHGWPSSESVRPSSESVLPRFLASFPNPFAITMLDRQREQFNSDPRGRPILGSGY